MKLTYAQLDTHLNKGLAAIYLISGEEAFLKNEVLAKIRKSAKLAHFNEHVRLLMHAQLDLSYFYSVLITPSLLAQQKIIEIDLQQALPSKEVALILEEYASLDRSDTILILNLPKVDQKLAKAKWFTACAQKGIQLPLWPIPAEQLPQWIMQRVAKYKLSITPAAAHLLSELTVGNLTATAQAIEKLYLLMPTLPIDEALVREVTIDEARFNVFDLIDAILSRQAPRALQVLQRLQEEGVEPTLLIWALTKEIRLLAELSTTTDPTLLSGLLAKQRLFPKRQAALKHFIKDITTRQCLGWLKKAMHLDLLTKGGLSGDIWQSLSLYCLELAST